MKKFIYILMIGIGLTFLSGCTSSEVNENSNNEEVVYDYDSVKDELIRFHVIANSDSKEDQGLKLKVRKDNGYSYNVQTELSRENFPEKVYGKIVLPQGEYEAYRILIGDASGQNWWCVMFPPLCFVDVTKGSVAYNETERRMDEVSKNKKTEENTDEEYELKFKIVEVLKDAF